MSKKFFKRKEKKYLLSREQFKKVRAKIEEEVVRDGFFLLIMHKTAENLSNFGRFFLLF